MSLNIKDEEVHELARKLAKLKGTSMTAVVREALKEKLAREEVSQPEEPPLAERLAPILARIDAMEVLDDRTDDEILGYDEFGMPK